MAVLGATSLTGCNSIPQFMPGVADVGASTASRTIFRMATSPVSWTKDTAAFDGMLRVVNGATLSPGGSASFPTVFTATAPLSVTLAQNIIGLTINQAAAFPGANLPSGPGGDSNTQPAAVSTAQITAHDHPYIAGATGSLAPGTTANHAAQATSPAQFTSTGQNQGHIHGIDAHTHQLLGTFQQHAHTISGQHGHTVTSTQTFHVNYVDMIVSIKD